MYAPLYTFTEHATEIMTERLFPLQLFKNTGLHVDSVKNFPLSFADPLQYMLTSLTQTCLLVCLKC